MGGCVCIVYIEKVNKPYSNFVYEEIRKEISETVVCRFNKTNVNENRRLERHLEIKTPFLTAKWKHSFLVRSLLLRKKLWPISRREKYSEKFRIYPPAVRIRFEEKNGSFDGKKERGEEKKEEERKKQQRGPGAIFMHLFIKQVLLAPRAG